MRKGVQNHPKEQCIEQVDYRMEVSRHEEHLVCAWKVWGENIEGLSQCIWASNVNMTKLVVPVESETAILRTRPIMCDHILLAENGKKELGIVIANILNTEIINNKRENEWTGAVHV